MRPWPFLFLVRGEEAFYLGDTALVDEVAVVGLALRDLAGDRREHHILHLRKILRGWSAFGSAPPRFLRDFACGGVIPLLLQK